MKQALVRFSLILLVLWGCVGLRADTIDQSYLGPPAPQFYGGPVGQMANGIGIAQTFTVGLAGELTRVQVLAFRLGEAVDPLEVEIRSTMNGIPDPGSDSILASSLISAQDVPENLSGLFVDFSSDGLMVTPGEVLAIVLESSEVTNGYGWAVAPGDPYSGGQGFFRSTNPNDGAFLRGDGDQYFATYVAPVPESGSGELLVIGLTLSTLLFDERLRRIFTRGS